MSDDWRTDTKGATLQGASGAGKTTTSRALHNEWDGPSIVFDLDEEPDLGIEVETVGELHEALSNGFEEIVVRTPTHVVEEPELFPEVVKYLMDLGESLRGGTTKMQFILGECQDLQQKWVKVAMKRMRKRNIKPIAETQDPISLSKRTRTVAEYQIWVSPPKSQMIDSLRSGGWPVEQMRDLPDHDALVLGDGWESIDRFRAGGKYVAE